VLCIRHGVRLLYCIYRLIPILGRGIFRAVVQKLWFLFQVTCSGEAADTSVITSDVLDDFTTQLSAEDARVLVDLLKLAVAMRAGPRGKEALSHVLTALGKTFPQVSSLDSYPAVLQNFM
jgi:hypothetical protein